MKKVLAIVIALVLCVACIGMASAETEKARVAFICKGYQDTYCLLVMNIFDAYVQENYSDLYTVDYFDGETDADKITQLVETCTANQYDVIILQQEDPDAVVAATNAALDAGVQVICTVGKVNDEGRSVFIDGDPMQQGTLVANYVVEQGILKEGTKVAILQGPAGQYHSNMRCQGYNDIIEQVGAEKLAQEICNWQKAEAQACVENWLVAYPDLEVILSANDDMALGAIEALKLAGNDSVYVVGVDANEEGCLALKDGTLKATVAQDTFGYAYGAADLTAAYLNGETIESTIKDSILVLPEDADEILMTVHGYSQEQIDALNS